MFDFARWFAEQHDTRTASGMAHLTDQQLREMVRQGKEADRALACRERWDDQHRSALYAVQAAIKQGAGYD